MLTVILIKIIMIRKIIIIILIIMISTHRVPSKPAQSGSLPARCGDWCIPWSSLSWLWQWIWFSQWIWLWHWTWLSQWWGWWSWRMFGHSECVNIYMRSTPLRKFYCAVKQSADRFTNIVPFLRTDTLKPNTGLHKLFPRERGQNIKFEPIFYTSVFYLISQQSLLD